MRSDLPFFSVLLAILFLASCSNSSSEKSGKQRVQVTENKEQKDENNNITLNYLNEIEGRQVRVYWKPIEIRYNYVIGPAIIEFYNVKDSTSFTLTSNHFSILKSDLHFTYDEDSLEIKSFNNHSLSVPYKNAFLHSKSWNFESINEPFFFADIDFDQKKELLIIEADQGQRGTVIYKAYSFDNPNISNEFEPSEMDMEPFRSLDGYSVIDYNNKSIIINNSGGACSSSQDIYKLQTAKNEDAHPLLALSSTIESQLDEVTGKCYELKYKVINNQKHLVSKREVKN